jgi:hypothetical protein
VLDEPELDFCRAGERPRRSLNGKVPRKLERALAGSRMRRAGNASPPSAGAARPRRDRRPALSARADGSRRRPARKRRWRIFRTRRRLVCVGLNWLCSDLSHEAFKRERARRSRTAPRASWGGWATPTRGRLWRELASPRRTGARPPGPARAQPATPPPGAPPRARPPARPDGGSGGRARLPASSSSPVDVPVQTRT